MKRWYFHIAGSGPGRDNVCIDIALHSLLSSFQMAVESNHANAITALRDWSRSLAPVFQPMRSNTDHTLYVRFNFYRALSKFLYR